MAGTHSQQVQSSTSMQQFHQSGHRNRPQINNFINQQHQICDLEITERKTLQHFLKIMKGFICKAGVIKILYPARRILF